MAGGIGGGAQGGADQLDDDVGEGFAAAGIDDGAADLGGLRRADAAAARRQRTTRRITGDDDSKQALLR